MTKSSDSKQSLSLSINTTNKITLNNINNTYVVCIKNPNNEMLFYIKELDKVLYCKVDFENDRMLYCYKEENIAALNLENNDFFTFKCTFFFNSKSNSSFLFIKAILNQFYFLKPYINNIYEETEEFKIWEKYLKVQEDIIDKKDFFFEPKNIKYEDNLAIIEVENELISKCKKGLSFKSYSLNEVDITKTLHLWDEEYLDNYEKFGNLTNINKSTIKIKLDPEVTKKTNLILRSSFFGDDIQLSRLKYGMEKISTHFFSNYMFGTKKIKIIDEKIESRNITYFNTKLNVSQQESVKKSLISEELFLIQGPPGTGKTDVITEIALQEVLRENKVLITSQMNLAVDEPLDRIKKQNSKIRIKKIDNSHNSYDDYNPQVYGATLNKCGSKEFRNLIFDVVIVDEVSKATPPELTLAILLSKKVILVGDHKQLPPTIKNEEIDLLAEELNININDLNFNKSIFETLIENNPDGYVMLDTQYRMHPDIAKTIAPFYNFKLLDGVDKTDKNHQLKIKQNLVWIDCDGKEDKKGTSYFNQIEITKIQDILNMLNKEYSNIEVKPSVGIITFYGAQLKLLNDDIVKNSYKNFNQKEFIINTVDRFQGQEKDIIILSMVRSNNDQYIGFAELPNRINVAFSRAKNMLVIVGNKETFSGKNSQCKHVIDLCRKS